MKKLLQGRLVFHLLTIGLLAIGSAGAGAAIFGPSGNSDEEKRQALRGQRDAVLKEAFVARPELKESLKQAAGYATFRQTDVNLFLLASANGYGLLVDTKSGKETFMRMAGIGGGVGMGVRDIRLLMVFRDAATMKQFVEQGWQVGGKADASAKYQETGVAAEQAVKANVDVKKGSVAVGSSTDARAGAPTEGTDRLATGLGSGIEVFQFTESGLSLQATIQGTKFWKDSKLNQ